MGNDEPVTPIFPNSDYCTGIIGVAGVLDALVRRASDGGSFRVDVSYPLESSRIILRSVCRWL